MKKLLIASILGLVLSSCVGSRKSNCPAYSLTVNTAPVVNAEPTEALAAE